MDLLEQIKQKSKAGFRPANPARLEELRALGVPDDAIAFYRNSKPAGCVEIAKVRLWPISQVLGENTDYVPGAYAYPCGYVVFGTTMYGDAFCFDIRQTSGRSAPVVLIAHDLEPENDVMKREDLEKLAKPIAPSFEDFLKGFVSETLDIKLLYPPFDPGNTGGITRP